MSQLFARYLEAGIFGSVIILLILLLRLCLRKAPRRVLCLLWLVAAVRLLLPFQLESRLSLQPDLENTVQLVQTQQPEYVPPVEIRIPVESTEVQPVIPPVTDTVPVDIKAPVDPMTVLTILWLSAAGAAMVYLLVSYWILKFRVREAVRCEDGVLECDRIRGAFLLGYLRPRIYLPFRVQKRDREFIIAHERAHIARGDNWWKLLGFVCAAIHWYNPLVWLAYVLLCRDIELACDERVIRQLDLGQRKAYSMALLNCGKSLAGVSVCPVAFGEVSLKTRIKSVLRYRKPGLWITVIAFVMVAVVAVCFLTSPMAEALPPEETPEQTQEQSEEQTQPSTEPPAVPTETESVPENTEHVHVYTVQTVAPTCTETGYDLHTCPCGDTFQSNPTEIGDHNWVHNPKYFYRKYDTVHPLVCTVCNEETWFHENVNSYPDLNYNGIRDAVLSYARSLGFQTQESGSLNNALSYSTYMDQSTLKVAGTDWEEYFTDQGSEFVDRAYAYCIANGLEVSEQTVLFENFHRRVNTRPDARPGLYEQRLYACLYFANIESSALETENMTKPAEPEAVPTQTTEPTEATEETETTESTESTVESDSTEKTDTEVSLEGYPPGSFVDIYGNIGIPWG